MDAALHIEFGNEMVGGDDGGDFVDGAGLTALVATLHVLGNGERGLKERTAFGEDELLDVPVAIGGELHAGDVGLVKFLRKDIQ